VDLTFANADRNSNVIAMMLCNPSNLPCAEHFEITEYICDDDANNGNKNATVLEKKNCAQVIHTVSGSRIGKQHSYERTEIQYVVETIQHNKQSAEIKYCYS